MLYNIPVSSSLEQHRILNDSGRSHHHDPLHDGGLQRMQCLCIGLPQLRWSMITDTGDNTAHFTHRMCQPTSPGSSMLQWLQQIARAIQQTIIATSAMMRNTHVSGEQFP